MSRVLLVRLSAMGDLVQSVGAVAALHDARPDLELCVVTQRPFAALLDGVPGVGPVVTHDRRGGARAWLRTRRALRALRCEVALDLQGNWKSALMARLSGCRRRIGAAARWRQEPRSAVLLTERVAVDGPRHPASVALAVVRALAPEAAARLPRLAAAPSEVDAAAATLQRLGVDPTRRFRVVVAGDPRDPRSQRPAALRRQLGQDAVPTLLLFGPGEASVPVPDGLPANVRVLRQGSGSLRELVGLGALVARVDGEVLGGDGGALHVLAATGPRTFALFGPQDPQRTAAPAARVLQHPRPPGCMPCRSRRCRHPDGAVCMDFVAAAVDLAADRVGPG